MEVSLTRFCQVLLPGIASAADGEEIAVRVIKGTRRRKRLAIRVTRSGDVEILVPVRTSESDIRWALHSRIDWIASHLRRIRMLPHLVAKTYSEGEEHFYLGSLYALEFESGSEDRGVRILADSTAGKLRIRMRNPEPGRVRAVLERWYREQARRIFAERMAALCPGITWLKGQPTWKIRTMRRRWGSCSRNGELTLNTHLIKAPLRCLDFVILHEMAHLREMNHSRRFYAVLESLLPDWKERKRELGRLGELFLAVD